MFIFASKNKTIRVFPEIDVPSADTGCHKADVTERWTDKTNKGKVIALCQPAYPGKHNRNLCFQYLLESFFFPSFFFIKKKPQKTVR